MYKIYKYQLDVTGTQKLTMPIGADPMCIQVIHGVPYLYGLVETNNNNYEYEIVILATGQDIEKSLLDYEYVDSFQLLDGDFIGHVFISWSYLSRDRCQLGSDRKIHDIRV